MCWWDEQVRGGIAGYNHVRLKMTCMIEKRFLPRAETLFTLFPSLSRSPSCSLSLSVGVVVCVRAREGELVTRSPLKAADPTEGLHLLWKIAMTELNKRSSRENSC